MVDANPLSMIEHEFNNSIGTYLSQSNFVAAFVTALIGVTRVTLSQTAHAFPSSIKPESNLKRIQRFLDDVRLTPDRFAQTITALLPVPRPWILALDRTDWKLGKTHLNLLIGADWLAWLIDRSLKPVT